MYGDPSSVQNQMSSYGWRPGIQTVKGGRSKSFPPDRLSPFPKSRIFILRHSLSRGGVGKGRECGMSEHIFLEDVGKPYSSSPIGDARLWEVPDLRKDSSIPPF